LKRKNVADYVFNDKLKMKQVPCKINSDELGLETGPNRISLKSISDKTAVKVF
jgi:hypothetical protein